MSKKSPLTPATAWSASTVSQQRRGGGDLRPPAVVEADAGRVVVDAEQVAADRAAGVGERRTSRTVTPGTTSQPASVVQVQDSGPRCRRGTQGAISPGTPSEVCGARCRSGAGGVGCRPAAASLGDRRADQHARHRGRDAQRRTTPRPRHSPHEGRSCTGQTTGRCSTAFSRVIRPGGRLPIADERLAGRADEQVERLPGRHLDGHRRHRDPALHAGHRGRPRGAAARCSAPASRRAGWCPRRARRNARLSSPSEVTSAVR